MKTTDIKIERNKHGIFASAKIFIGGKFEQVTIWAKPGHYADEYKSKVDAEIQQIAIDQWHSLLAIGLGSMTSARKAKSSAENGKLGGRPKLKH